ncbi:MAG: YdeI/OmpD-associated family protein [Actinomycetota bacterium]|nr:YdeI/OmpD-associated family protein [Actinomycetota bacterium]
MSDAATGKDGLPLLAFASQRAWEEWLEENHASAPGMWLKLAKKASGVASVSYPEAVESALCFGWIDGLKRPLDERFSLQRFTPRRKKSKWSRINKDRATELIASGRMRPAGLAAVEAAKADGRWDAAYDPQSDAPVPEDLQRELDANPEAAAFFATLKGAKRYAFLYRIADAKRPETRARRIEQFVAMMNEGKTLY